MKPTEPRAQAVRILKAVEEQSAFADAALGRTLAERTFDPRDAALLTRLVYGVLAWQLRLDWSLSHFARRPLAAMDPAVVIVLRLGLFQLLFLDRIPPHAAVNTSVDLGRKLGGGGAAKFVNAILRRVLREGEFALPDAASDLAAHLAIRWSHPQWLVERWLDEFGATRTATLLEANQQAAPTCARVDLGRESREAALERLAAAGIEAHAGRFAAGAIVLDSPLGAVLPRPRPTPGQGSATDPLRPGRRGPGSPLGLALQGEASQLVAAALGVCPGERIADLCAAPGGKSGALAECLDGRGVLIAADLSRAGVRSLATRLGKTPTESEPTPTLHLLCQDGTLPALRPGSFDALLLDAPCTGLGTLRQHPEIRWRRTPDDLDAAAALQLKLLHAAASLLRPGGRLVYSTCSLGKTENEDVVDAFLREDPRFIRDGLAPFLPESARLLVDAQGALQTAPDSEGLDGFFAARLVRRPEL